MSEFVQCSEVRQQTNPPAVCVLQDQLPKPLQERRVTASNVFPHGVCVCREVTRRARISDDDLSRTLPAGDVENPEEAVALGWDDAASLVLAQGGTRQLPDGLRIYPDRTCCPVERQSLAPHFRDGVEGLCPSLLMLRFHRADLAECSRVW